MTLKGIYIFLYIMETLPDDLFQKIFCFLSLKQKILLRETCHFFKSRQNPMILSAYKLECLLKISHPIEMKLSSDLTCYTTYNNFTIYKTNQRETVHPLFRINNNYDTCIVDTCREKKLGYIFFSKKPALLYHQSSNPWCFYNKPAPLYHQSWNPWCFYNKRNIPYCNGCFKMWSIYIKTDYMEIG